MKSKEQEEEFLNKLFVESERQAEVDITERVMHQISLNSEVFEYRPIIGRKAWTGIAVLFVLSIIYLMPLSSAWTLPIPSYLTSIGTFLRQVPASFQFDWSIPQLPEVSTTGLVILVALNVIGVYLIGYRWTRKLIN